MTDRQTASYLQCSSTNTPSINLPAYMAACADDTLSFLNAARCMILQDHHPIGKENIRETLKRML
jgi:hypothetical protein